MTREPSPADAIDGRALLAEARSLAFPRYPGSAGDKRAIERVAERMRSAGLEVIVEEFSYDVRPAFRALRATLLSAALLAAVAGLAAARSAPLGLAALGLAAVAGGALLVWSPGAERLYAGAGPTCTANVTGRRAAARPRSTLVLVAHHDSKSQNLSFPVRMGLTLAALGAAGALFLALLATASGIASPPAWLGAALGGMTAVALAGLATLRSGNASPGGVDNAGSLAILLELARTLPPAMPEQVELLFVSTGAEEDHMVGAMRWLDAHVEDLRGRPVHAINLDGAGAPGRVVLIERYGLGRPLAPTVTAAARRPARRLGLRPRGITMPPAIGIDAIPFAHRGLECLTLASGSLGRATMAVHSSRDVAEHLDAATLASVARLAVETALELTCDRAPGRRPS